MHLSELRQTFLKNNREKQLLKELSTLSMDEQQLFHSIIAEIQQCANKGSDKCELHFDAENAKNVLSIVAHQGYTIKRKVNADKSLSIEFSGWAG